MIDSKLRLSPFDFLLDAAKSNFFETGIRTKSFILPLEMLEELKLDHRTRNGGFNFMVYVNRFPVVGTNNQSPKLIDVLSNKVPLL